MEKLKDIFVNHNKVTLAYNKLVDVIVWEDNKFMMKYSIKEVQDFIKKYIEKNAEKDILALRDSMLGLKKQYTTTTEKEEEEVIIVEGNMAFRDELLCEIRRKYTFNEDDYAVIKNEMRAQFVEHNAKSFVFKVLHDCNKSPKLCTDDDSAHVVLGDCYLPELENFLDYNYFNVFKEEHISDIYYIYVNLGD